MKPILTTLEIPKKFCQIQLKGACKATTCNEDFKMGQAIQEWTKYNLWKAAFKKLGRQYRFKFFKDCLPQMLLGPLLNTLTQVFKK